MPKLTRWPAKAKTRSNSSWAKDFRKNKVLYLLFIPVLVWLIVFHYAPMPGLFMAFQNYSIKRELFGSQFVGLQNFIDLFTGSGFPLAFRNTCAMALLSLTVGFLPPILFAIALTTFPHKGVRRGCQLASYLPNFISAVVMCSLATEFLSDKGAITQLLCLLGADKQNWLANPNIPVFWIIYTCIGIWQGIGWGSIVYVAAINNVSGDLHEAAAIAGATESGIPFAVTYAGNVEPEFNGANTPMTINSEFTGMYNPNASAGTAEPTVVTTMRCEEVQVGLPMSVALRLDCYDDGTCKLIVEVAQIGAELEADKGTYTVSETMKYAFAFEAAGEVAGEPDYATASESGVDINVAYAADVEVEFNGANTPLSIDATLTGTHSA